jgi:hypothetical protein
VRSFARTFFAILQAGKRESVRKIQYGFRALPIDEDIYALGGCVIFDNQPSFRCIECGWEG